MGVDGMSTDDTDGPPPQAGAHRKVRRVHKNWRSAELTNLYLIVDTYHSSFNLDGRRKTGTKPLSRALEPHRTSTRAPVVGLPANFYNPFFLLNAKDFEKRNLCITSISPLPSIVSHLLCFQSCSPDLDSYMTDGID